MLLKRSPVLFGHSQRVASILKVLYCSNGLQKLLDTFPTMSRHTFRHSFTFPLKIKDTTENLKTISGSSPNYALSIHTITQIGATVPLRGRRLVSNLPLFKGYKLNPPVMVWWNSCNRYPISYYISSLTRYFLRTKKGAFFQPQKFWANPIWWDGLFKGVQSDPRRVRSIPFGYCLAWRGVSFRTKKKCRMSSQDCESVHMHCR